MMIECKISESSRHHAIQPELTRTRNMKKYLLIDWKFMHYDWILSLSCQFLDFVLLLVCWWPSLDNHAILSADASHPLICLINRGRHRCLFMTSSLIQLNTPTNSYTVLTKILLRVQTRQTSVFSIISCWVKILPAPVQMHGSMRCAFVAMRRWRWSLMSLANCTSFPWIPCKSFCRTKLLTWAQIPPNVVVGSYAKKMWIIKVCESRKTFSLSVYVVIEIYRDSSSD